MGRSPRPHSRCRADEANVQTKGLQQAAGEPTIPGLRELLHRFRDTSTVRPHGSEGARLLAPVLATSARKPKCPARCGPTHRRALGGCLWSHSGSISFNAAAPCSWLDDCHLLPVSAFLD